VADIRVKTSSGYRRLDDTAIKAVKRWRYAPARRGTETIDYWYLQPIEFALN
jgi:protein TonB